MSDFYDNFETRDPQQRQQEQLKALIEQLKHAKLRAPAYQQLPVEDVSAIKTFASLPLPRKSSLL